jgi:hypothetical protein
MSTIAAIVFIEDVNGKTQMPCGTCHLMMMCSPNMWRKVYGGEELQLATCNLFTNVPDEVRTLAADQFSTLMRADASRACSSCTAVTQLAQFADDDPFVFVNHMMDLMPNPPKRCCALQKIATRDNWHNSCFQLPEGNFLHHNPKAVRQEALRRMKALSALSGKSCVECAQFEK